MLRRLINRWLNRERNLRDGDYVLIDGAAWFTVGKFSIRIHQTDEGVVVDAQGCVEDGHQAIPLEDKRK